MRPVTRGQDEEGRPIVAFWADQTHDGFGSLLAYLEQHWRGQVVERIDDVYAANARIEIDRRPFILTYDSVIGVSLRPEQERDVAVLDAIYADLADRLSTLT